MPTDRHPVMDLVRRPITDAAEANQALNALYSMAANKDCVAARGPQYLGQIMPGFALVLVDVWPDEDDVLDMKKKGWLYRGTFLRRLMDVMGLRITSTVRCDDGLEPHRREYEVAVEGADLRLTRRVWRGSYELDLRDGSTRANDLKAAMLREKRTHITSQAETGALSRAILAALAIPRGYNGNDAENRIYSPIIVPVMELNAATASDEVRQAMSLAAVQSAIGAYGPAPEPPRIQHAPPAPYVPSDDPEDDLGEVDEPPLADEDEGPTPEVDAPVDDEPPLDDTNDPERAITAQEKAKLKEIGAFKQSILKGLGWSGEGHVSKRVYDAALAEYGGAS